MNMSLLPSKLCMSLGPLICKKSATTPVCQARRDDAVSSYISSGSGVLRRCGVAAGIFSPFSADHCGAKVGAETNLTYNDYALFSCTTPHLGYGVSRLWTYKKDEFNNIIVCDSPRDDGCARASRTNRYRDWAGYVTICCTSAPKEASLHCSHSLIQSFAELTA